MSYHLKPEAEDRYKEYLKKRYSEKRAKEFSEKIKNKKRQNN
jgi:hypothetical protein